MERETRGAIHAVDRMEYVVDADYLAALEALDEETIRRLMRETPE